MELLVRAICWLAATVVSAALDLLRAITLMLAGIAVLGAATYWFGTAGLLAVGIPMIGAMAWYAVTRPSGAGDGADDGDGGD